MYSIIDDATEASQFFVLLKGKGWVFSELWRNWGWRAPSYLVTKLSTTQRGPNSHQTRLKNIKSKQILQSGALHLVISCPTGCLRSRLLSKAVNRVRAERRRRVCWTSQTGGVWLAIMQPVWGAWAPLCNTNDSPTYNALPIAWDIELIKSLYIQRSLFLCSL